MLGGKLPERRGSSRHHSQSTSRCPPSTNLIQQVHDDELEKSNWLILKTQASAFAELIHTALPGLTSLSTECGWHVDFLRELASASVMLQTISIVGDLDEEESEAIGRFTSLRKVRIEGHVEAIVHFAGLPHLEVLLCKDPYYNVDDEGLSKVLRCCTRLRELEIPRLPRGWHLQSSSLSSLTLGSVYLLLSDRLDLACLPHLQSLSVHALYINTLYMYDDLKMEGIMRASSAAAPASPSPSLAVHLDCVECGVNRDAAEALLVAHGWQPAWESVPPSGVSSYQAFPTGRTQQCAADMMLWRVLSSPS